MNSGKNGREVFSEHFRAHTATCEPYACPLLNATGGHRKSGLRWIYLQNGQLPEAQTELAMGAAFAATAPTSTKRMAKYLRIQTSFPFQTLQPAP
jgi:hypothetical protein